VESADQRDTAGPHRLLNRELSWLDFNARVLALAEDAERPLLERAKFLAIFATNLDEFV
jgi:polyphosphate kinase